MDGWRKVGREEEMEGETEGMNQKERRKPGGYDLH